MSQDCVCIVWIGDQRGCRSRLLHRVEVGGRVRASIKGALHNTCIGVQTQCSPAYGVVTQLTHASKWAARSAWAIF